MKLKVSAILLTAVLLSSGSFSYAHAAVNASTPADFNDISNHWSKGAIQSLSQKGAIPYTGQQFAPNKAVVKSDFVLMLHNALDIHMEYLKAPDIKDYYDDVNQDAPYASALIDLATANIFQSKGHFNPNATLTREEMVHYVMLAYKYKMGDNYALIKISPATFADTDGITPEYSGEVARAQHYNLINGNEKNLFNPKALATRGEAAVVINRLVQLLDTQNQKVTITPEAVVQNDSLLMKLTIKNDTKQDVYIENTSGQRFDFELLDQNKNSLYRWSADKSFTLALSTVKIEAGETIVFSDTLSGEQYKNIKDKVVYMKGFITGTASFINADGYEIRLK